MHKTNNVNDGYMGSGKLIKAAIKKYGLEFFIKEILFIFDNELDMKEKEKELVVISEETYNLCPGGHGGFGYINNFKINNKNHENARQKQSKALKEYCSIPEIKEKRRLNLIEQHRTGKRKSFFGPNALEKSKTKEAILKRKETFALIGHQKGEKNSQYGKPRSEETKQKIRKTLLAKRNNAEFV